MDHEYNNENNMYHYNYREEPKPQDDYRPSPPVYDTGCRPEHESPKKRKSGFWRKKSTQITAVILACALLGGLCGFGGAMLAKNAGRGHSTIQESTRPATTVSIKKVDGQTLMTPAEVYAATANSVASINCSASSTNIFGQKVESASSGSGFVITADGYIVTNQHVVSGASSISVTLYNGDTYPATLVGGDSDYDVAVLKVNANSLTPVTMGNSADVNVGDTVLAIGNPLGELTFSMSQGIVSCCDRAINVDGTPFNMIQVDASINPGNSGGPLMNLYGEVVGIVSAKYSSFSNTMVEGLGFAIPMDDVADMVSELVTNGYVTGKPLMGISVGDVAQEVQNYGVPAGAEVLVVTPGLCGEKAGLQAGDIITKIDDTEVTCSDELISAKNEYAPGDTVKLTVYRSGQTMEVKLTLEESTPEKTALQDEAQTEYQQQYQQQQQQQQQQQSGGWPFSGFGY